MQNRMVHGSNSFCGGKGWTDVNPKRTGICFWSACLMLTASVRAGYEAWIGDYGLSGVSADRTADPDGDGYDNMQEYALGLHPGVADAAGADRLVLSNGYARITLPDPPREDVFYQILRSSDAAPGNLCEDWEIFASRWKTDAWVGDYAIEEEEDPTTGESTVLFTLPSDYTNHQFKVVAMDPGIYPEFAWETIETWSFPRRPHINQDGFDQFTADDFAFIAAMGITGAGLVTIPETNGIPLYSDLDDVLAINPDHKNISYINGAIVIPSAYGGLAYSNDLTYDDYCLWDETKNEWAISRTAVDRPFIDYRKPAGFQRQCDVVSAFKATGNHGIFMDALTKNGGGMAAITNVNDKLDYLDRYFDFLSFMRSEHADGIRMVNARPGSGPEAYLDAYTTSRYRSLEALLNAYFNSLYFENWYSVDKDRLSQTLDWVISKWTRHGRLFLITSAGTDPSNSVDMMHLAAVMTMMGRNTFVRFLDGTHLRYREGGWKNPSYWQFLADKKPGLPLSDAVRTGYVYRREFEFARVTLDLEKRTCSIEWLNDDGSVQEVWRKSSNIHPSAKRIGGDDFDGGANYLTRSFSERINTSAFTWDIVNRTNVQCQAIIDTSEYTASGGIGDGTDTVGFLKSDKTDNFFGLYRGNGRTLTYTFDVAGYTNLSIGMDWAAAGDIPPPGITVTASIDGAPAQTVFEITYSTSPPTYVMENGASVTNNRSAVGHENGVAASTLLNRFGSFAAKIDGSGSTLTLEISMSSGVSGPAYGMDNLTLYGLKIGGYDAWISGYGLSGADAEPDADPGGDGINNLLKFALGGDPTRARSIIFPRLGKPPDERGLEYIYSRRRDAAARGLTYTVNVATHLVSAAWGTNGITESGAGIVDAEFEVVTNRLNIGDAGFVQLRIETER